MKASLGFAPVLFALGATTTLRAQSVTTRHLAPDDAAPMIIEHAAAPPVDYRAGGTIWSEDFSGGWPAGWTTQDTSGICPWKWSLDGSWGFFNGNSGTAGGTVIASTTAGDGFLIADNDSANNVTYGQPSSTQYQYLATYFTTTPIDLTGYPAVKLEFEQYFRYNNAPTLNVQVSNDGVTWTTWDVKGGVVANAASANVDLVELNISAVAGNQATVYIRIGWNARVYFWMIDDMRIVTLPDHDMTIDQGFIAQTDASYMDLGVRSMEYHMLPVQQAAPVVVGAALQNSGGAAQTNIVIEATITQDGVPQGTFASSPIAVMTASEVDSFYINTGWTPSSPGLVEVSYSVSADSADIDPSDNIATRRFTVTGPAPADGNDQMTPDRGPATGTFYNISMGGTNSGIGNKYEMVPSGSLAYGIGVSMMTGSDVGALVQVELWRDDGVDQELIAVSDLLEVEDWHLHATGDSTVLFIPFSDSESPEPVPADLDPAYEYIAFINTLGTENVRVATSGPINRGGLWGISASDGTLTQYVGTGNLATLVRLYLSMGPVSVQEAGDDLLHDALIQPNPASEEVTISFTSSAADRLELRVIDAMGRVVGTQDLGARAQGTHRIAYDAGELVPGQYACVIAGDRGQLVMNMMVVR